MDDLIEKPHLGNELGGYEYTKEQEQFLSQLAMFMKSRHSLPPHLKDAKPHEYMKYYVKAAGIVAEAAMRLREASDLRTFRGWVEVLTGFPEDR